MKKSDNLRGMVVTFAHPTTGSPCRGIVITHTRGSRWVIQSGRLPLRCERFGTRGPRRIILDRSEFSVTGETNA